MLQRGVEFDVIGLSYYPWWHGTFEDMEKNLEFLSNKLHRKFLWWKPLIMPMTGTLNRENMFMIYNPTQHRNRVSTIFWLTWPHD